MSIWVTTYVTALESACIALHQAAREWPEGSPVSGELRMLARELNDRAKRLKEKLVEEAP